MKINLLHKKLSKSLLLASAIAALSLSSAYATDFIGVEGDYVSFTNQIESSGTIHNLNNGYVDFMDSTLGNASGGRFTATIGAPASTHPLGYTSLSFENNVTAYFDNLNFVHNATQSFMLINSKAYVDNAIIATGGNASITVFDSIFIAPSFTGHALNIHSQSHVECAVNVYGVQVTDQSYWKSIGSSTISNNFSINDNSTLELLMTSATDKISVGNLLSVYDSKNIMKFSFTDDFIESIYSGLGYFDLDANATIVATTRSGDGAIIWDVTDFNDSYTWTVTDLTGGIYRISDIVAIPEPSTYAMIFGILALGLAIYRRRK